MRVRYHRHPVPANVRDYNVQVQDKPRGRWLTAGMVSRFSAGTWAALGGDVPGRGPSTAPPAARPSATCWPAGPPGPEGGAR